MFQKQVNSRYQTRAFCLLSCESGFKLSEPAWSAVEVPAYRSKGHVVYSPGHGRVQFPLHPVDLALLSIIGRGEPGYFPGGSCTIVELVLQLNVAIPVRHPRLIELV